jgi:tRNA-specific 2-thiouridylase
MIRTVDGRIIGEHEGLHRYTLGQRQGLVLTGLTKENADYAVVGFDVVDQTLIVGPERANYHRELMGKRANWLRPTDQLRGLRCHARVRPGETEAPCLVTSFENGEIHVQFDEPQHGPSPGQAVVFYDGDEVLGGAFIDRILSDS